ATSPSSPWWRWPWPSWPPSTRRAARRARTRRRRCAMSEPAMKHAAAAADDATGAYAARRTDEVVGAHGLGKTYAEGRMRTPVFDGLDLSVSAGETVAILGASGAGKSTLLHLLGGLDTPSAGEVFVSGQRMGALSDAERGRLRNRALGFVYQFHHLLPEFTALENVMLPVLLSGAGVPDASGRARALLEAVGLGHRLEHKPGELSGGERQRAAVARALVN